MAKRTLAGIRKDLGLNQDEMAKVIGVNVCTWRNKETYKTDLTATELMTICGLADCDPFEIVLKS